MGKRWIMLLSFVCLSFILIIAASVWFIKRSYDNWQVLDVHQHIQQHRALLDGKVTQKLSYYYAKGDQTAPVTVHVSLGDYVNVGDPLYSYENEDMTFEEKEITLKIDNERIEKEQVEGQIQSYNQKLYDANTKERPEIEAQLKWLDSERSKSENNIKRFEEERKKVSNKVEKLTVTSSVSGEVASINEDALNNFSKENQTEPIMTIATEGVQIEGLASRYDMQFMEEGLKATVIETVNDDTHKATLEHIEVIPKERIENRSSKQTIRNYAHQPNFKYVAELDKEVQLYDNDPVEVNVRLSHTDHIWIPQRFVRKEVKKERGYEETNYFVDKLEGSSTKQHKVTVEKKLGPYYLITNGVSKADRLKATK